MKKSFITKLVSCALVTTMLAGCGSSAGTAASSKTTSGGTDTAASGDAESITCMIWDRSDAASGTTMEDNPLANWIKEQVLKDCNVNVSYVSVPRSGSDDKLNTMMTGGNAPDVIFTYSQALFGNYTSQGGVADLTDSLAKYGQNITDNIGNIQYMGQYDGKQYAIMKRRGFQIPRHITYVRKDWCDALGMEVPTTKDELIKYLYTVKEKNPGNVANVVPWAMGGTTDTEKFYLNFIGSYVPELSDKDAYVYSENFIVFADGAMDGLKEMNKMYNDGIISQDFAVDTTNDQYKQDVTSGNAGFILDDSTNIFDYIPTLQSTVKGAEFVATNCLTLPDGSYRNPTEPLYGMYIMVPATSQKKTDAVVKYLNWLADPTNAENVEFTPDHQKTADGAPIALTSEEKTAKGYPGTPNDYNIVNQHFKYVDSKEGQVSSWTSTCTWETQDWFNNLYDVCTTAQYLYPTTPKVLDSETQYKSNLESMCISYVYNLISCKPEDFEATQASEYQKLVDAGLEKILEERASYYDTGAVTSAASSAATSN